MGLNHHSQMERLLQPYKPYTPRVYPNDKIVSIGQQMTSTALKCFMTFRFLTQLQFATEKLSCRQLTSHPFLGEWRDVVTRLGRWIDFDNDYKTLYPWFMESVWWVFKELFAKGLVYKGYKVMPFSTACSTPLSNFESGQNYKDVIDPAVVVRFPLLDAGDEGK